MADLYLAELTVWDPAIGSPRVLRYANQGYVTSASESPPSTLYEERIKAPANVNRDLFEAGTTQGRSRMGYGDLVLANDDGALDALLGYGFDGRSLTIRQASWDSGVRPVYPTAFNAFVATMDQPEVRAQTVIIKVRDRQLELDVPLQTTKYAGTNTLPTGLEGVATDLKGKPKPLCFGVVKNIAPPCVNTAKLIYQVNDGAVAAINGVYDKGILLTSPRKWTSQTSGFGAGQLSALAYGAGLWVEVGGSGSALISTSPDTVTWTSRTIPAGHTPYSALTYGGGLFVAGTDSGQIATSPDGITWTDRTSPFTSTINDVIYANSLYVAVGNAGAVATSPDGTTWTSRTSGFGATLVAAVSYGAGLFVIGGDVGKVATSPDAITWTLGTSGVTTLINDIAFGAGIFAVGLNSGPLLSSPDGIAWTQQTVPNVTSIAIYAMEYGNGFFVGGGASGTMIISRDAKLWEVITSFTTSNLVTVAFGNGIYVAGGFSGALGSTPATGGTYSSLADLSDDTLAPAQGTYKVYLAGGYFRLGSTPVGLVTADVTEGTTVADRTAAQVFKRVLAKIGKTSADWSAVDVTTLDVAANYVIGDWYDQEISASLVLDRVAGSVGAWWGVDLAGVYRIQQLILATGSLVAAFTANDLLEPLDRIPMNDPGRGIPVYRYVVRYGRLHAIQTTDLAGGVADDRRAELAKEWREQSYTDASVQTAHLLSPQVIDDSLLSTAADALAEATRRQILRGTQRDRFDLVLQSTPANMAIDLNAEVSLTHPRYGLAAGKNFRVIGIQPSPATNRITLSVWG